MNLVIGSAFRDTQPAQVREYFDRVWALMTFWRGGLRVIAAEGDSVTDTRGAIRSEAARCGLDVDFPECATGAPRYGSTEQPERMAALSIVGNAIFGAVRPEDDVLIYVENDLEWAPEVMGALVDAVISEMDGFDVLAPLVFAGPLFYDIWGFRAIDGTRFSPFFPYHEDLGPHHETGCPLEVSSVGSCLVMQGEVARAARMRRGGALVDWCEDARRLGYRIGAWPALTIRHPG